MTGLTEQTCTKGNGRKQCDHSGYTNNITLHDYSPSAQRGLVLIQYPLKGGSFWIGHLVREEPVRL
jgi:hypothetical protein